MNTYSEKKKKKPEEHNIKKKKNSTKKQSSDASILKDALTSSQEEASKENTKDIKNYIQSNYTNAQDQANSFNPTIEYTANNFNKLHYILAILKSDYRNINKTYISFKKLQKAKIDKKKLNLTLNSIESSLYENLKQLNTVSKTVDGNENIKSALNDIFNYDDIAAHASLFAYNIYSLIKMFHFNKNYDYDKKQRKNKFKKHDFDTLKLLRDEAISSLQSYPSLKLSSNQKLNLQILRKDRLDMEGLKSNLRLKSLSDSRNKELNYYLVNTKYKLDGIMFNSQLNYMKILAEKSALSAHNSSKFF